LDREIKVGIIGVGNLGHAMQGTYFRGMILRRTDHLKLVALFDSNPRVVGELINGVPIDHIDNFHGKAMELGSGWYVIAVPAEEAQTVMDKVCCRRNRGCAQLCACTSERG